MNTLSLMIIFPEQHNPESFIFHQMYNQLYLPRLKILTTVRASLNTKPIIFTFRVLKLVITLHVFIVNPLLFLPIRIPTNPASFVLIGA